jgi:hypothetical protein
MYNGRGAFKVTIAGAGETKILFDGSLNAFILRTEG